MQLNSGCSASSVGAVLRWCAARRTSYRQTNAGRTGPGDQDCRAGPVRLLADGHQLRLAVQHSRPDRHGDTRCNGPPGTCACLRSHQHTPREVGSRSLSRQGVPGRWCSECWRSWPPVSVASTPGRSTATRASESWSRSPVQALGKIRIAEELDPWSMQTQYEAATAYARLDDYAAARTVLLHAEQLEPENYVPPALLGDIATRAGDQATALRGVPPCVATPSARTHAPAGCRHGAGGGPMNSDPTRIVSVLETPVGPRSTRRHRRARLPQAARAGLSPEAPHSG